MKLVKFTFALLCAYVSTATIFADGLIHQPSSEQSSSGGPDIGALIGLLLALLSIGILVFFAAKDSRKNRRSDSSKDNHPMAE